MMETFLSGLDHWSRRDGLLDRFEQKHPLLSMMVFQAAVGMMLIGAVGGIAFAGGMLIWMFYRMIGVM